MINNMTVTYHIHLPRGQAWDHKTSSTPPLLYESVPSKDHDRSYICALGVDIMPLSTIFQLDCRTIPTVWYFFVFHFNTNYT
jgi:hypothetical protein